MFNTMYTTIHLIESIFLFLLLYMAFSQENRKLLQLLLELLQVYRYRKRIHIISVIQYQLLTTKSKYIIVFHNISFQASKPFWRFQVMVVPQMRSLLFLLLFFNACLYCLYYLPKLVSARFDSVLLGSACIILDYQLAAYRPESISTQFSSIIIIIVFLYR